MVCRCPSGARHDPGRARERATAARGLDHCRRIRHRHPGRSVRHRRRRAHRAGAVRSLPRARCARRGALPALRRHVDRDHRADQCALVPHPPRQGRGDDGRGPRLDAARGDRRRGRRGRRGLRARGGAAAAAAASFAPAAVLKLAFVLVGSVISVKLLVGPDSWRLADDLPGPGGMTVYGFFIGLAASLMGISGGSISNMILTLHGKSMHRAVATSAGLGVPITIVGTIGYVLAGFPQQALMPPLSLGFVSLIGFALMAPVSSFPAPYGARLAHALSKRRLEVAFGSFLLLVCLRFVASLIGYG